MHELNAETFVHSVNPIDVSMRIENRIKPFCHSITVRCGLKLFLIADGEVTFKREEHGISIRISAQTIVNFYGIRTILSCYIYLEISVTSICWIPKRCSGPLKLDRL